jgi:hypothetical protein
MKPGAIRRVAPPAGGLLALLLGIAAIDPDVRASLVGLLSGETSPQVAGVGWYVQDAARVVVQTLRDQSLEHGPLMVFALAATVLVLFMLRV